MLYAGCDIGVVSAKAAIMDDDGLLACDILPYSSFPQEAASAILERVLGQVGLQGKKIGRCVSTGFGWRAVPHADGMAPDTVCLQRAIRRLNPTVRTVINVGGHSFMAFYVDAAGGLGESAVTDFCTAGMGMFLEAISTALEVPLNDMAENMSLPRRALFIDNQCPIFAESEAISLINDGHDKRDVYAGVVSAVANKIAGQVKRLGVVREVAMVGGVAKNLPVMAILQKNLGLRFADLRGFDPQVTAAYGAALLAKEGCSLDSGTLSSSVAERLHGEGNP